MKYPIHCLRCQKTTDTHSLTGGHTIHGRRMVKGGCVACNARKSRFVRDGDGIFGDIWGGIKSAAGHVKDTFEGKHNKAISKYVGKAYQTVAPLASGLNLLVPGAGTLASHAFKYSGDRLAANGEGLRPKRVYKRRS